MKDDNEFLSNPQFSDAALIAGARTNTWPIVVCGPGARPVTVPYGTPLPYSLRTVQAGLDVVMAQAPVIGLSPKSCKIAGGVASATVGLPGFPGHATGPSSFAKFNFALVNVGRDANVSSVPYAFKLSGQFAESGETYETPVMQFAWDGKADEAWILVAVAKKADSGPVPTLAWLTTSDMPSKRDTNGAADSVTPAGLKIDVTEGDDGTAFVLNAITIDHNMFPAILQLTDHRAMSDALPLQSAGVQVHQIISPLAARAIGAHPAFAR